MTGLYELMLDRLRTMDEKQLLELFHDIGEIDVIERIADCAYYFIEKHQDDKIKWQETNGSGLKEAFTIHHPNPWKEEKEADDARRHREHEESERRNY